MACLYSDGMVMRARSTSLFQQLAIEQRFRTRGVHDWGKLDGVYSGQHAELTRVSRQHGVWKLSLDMLSGLVCPACIDITCVYLAKLRKLVQLCDPHALRLLSTLGPHDDPGCVEHICSSNCLNAAATAREAWKRTTVEPRGRMIRWHRHMCDTFTYSTVIGSFEIVDFHTRRDPYYIGAARLYVERRHEGAYQQSSSQRPRADPRPGSLALHMRLPSHSTRASSTRSCVPSCAT